MLFKILKGNAYACRIQLMEIQRPLPSAILVGTVTQAAATTTFYIDLAVTVTFPVVVIFNFIILEVSAL